MMYEYISLVHVIIYCTCKKPVKQAYNLLHSVNNKGQYTVYMVSIISYNPFSYNSNNNNILQKLVKSKIVSKTLPILVLW